MSILLFILIVHSLVHLRVTIAVNSKSSLTANAAKDLKKKCRITWERKIRTNENRQQSHRQSRVVPNIHIFAIPI